MRRKGPKIRVRSENGEMGRTFLLGSNAGFVFILGVFEGVSS